MKKCLLIVFAILLLFSTVCVAHPGRTDKYGGHTNKETGEYHYHNADGSITVAPNPNKSNNTSNSKQEDGNTQINVQNNTEAVTNSSSNVVVDGDEKPVQESVSENTMRETEIITDVEEVIKVRADNGDTIIYVPHSTPYSNLGLWLWILLIALSVIGWCAVSPLICIGLKKIESKNSAFAIILHVPYLLFWPASLLGNYLYKLYNKINPKKEIPYEENFEDDEEYEI